MTNRPRPPATELERDIPPHHKKAVASRKKKFGIEYKYPRMSEWVRWRWYATEKQRDSAIADLIKNVPVYFRKEERGPKYRKCNR